MIMKECSLKDVVFAHAYVDEYCNMARSIANAYTSRPEYQDLPIEQFTEVYANIFLRSYNTLGKLIEEEKKQNSIFRSK